MRGRGCKHADRRSSLSTRRRAQAAALQHLLKFQQCVPHSLSLHPSFAMDTPTASELLALLAPESHTADRLLHHLEFLSETLTSVHNKLMADNHYRAARVVRVLDLVGAVRFLAHDGPTLLANDERILAVHHHADMVADIKLIPPERRRHIRLSAHSIWTLRSLLNNEHLTYLDTKKRVDAWVRARNRQPPPASTWSWPCSIQ